MNKLFRPKCLRRVLLCLALLFPVVYLCGGLFFALAGAHGENVLATQEEVIVKKENYKIRNIWNITDVSSSYGNNATNFEKVGNLQYVTLGSGTGYFNIAPAIFDSYNTVYLSRIRFDSYSFSNASFCSVASSYTSSVIDGVLYTRWIRTGSNNSFVVRFNNTNSSIRVAYDTSAIETFDLTAMYSVGNEPSIEEFYNVFGNDFRSYSTDYTDITHYVYGIPEEQNTLFFHIFGNRNFINQLGIDLVNGSTKGFNPMNELFRTINTNIMHFDDSDNLAMFGLGYVYYAVNVLIIYEVLILAVKLIMLPLKAVELFDKKEDI